MIRTTVWGVLVIWGFRIPLLARILWRVPSKNYAGFGFGAVGCRVPVTVLSYIYDEGLYSFGVLGVLGWLLP